MLFENNIGKSERARLDETKGINKGFRWVTVKEGGNIDLPEHYGKALGFTAVKTKPSVDAKAPGKNKGIKGLLNRNKGKDAPKEEKGEGETDYKTKLMALDGIAEKTADDIIKSYPTEQDLKNAINTAQHLPFRNDVVELLEKEFGE